MTRVAPTTAVLVPQAQLTLHAYNPWPLTALIFCMFLVHRIVFFGHLAGTIGGGSAAAAKAFIVGLGSDLWIAGGLACVVILSRGAAAFVRARRAGAIAGAQATDGRPLSARGEGRALAWLLWGLLAILLAGHAEYVGFFHHPFALHHIPYFWDVSFLRSNYGSLWAWEPWAPALVLLVFGVWSMILKRRRGRSDHPSADRTRGTLPMLALWWLSFFAVVVTAHVLQIRYRVQWYVPQGLQHNVFEQIIRDASRLQTVARLSPEEEALANVPPQSPPGAALRHWLGLSAQQTMSPELAQIRGVFAGAEAEGRRPRVLVVLMESMRAADMEARDAGSGAFLIPSWQSVLPESVSFSRAYATGNVTRGAQEAIYCGYWGNAFDSAMRRTGELPWPCLPAALQARPSPVPLWWLHGGEGAFDGQMSFWRGRGVQKLVHSGDFPESVAATQWGVSDREFFARVVRDLDQDRQSDGSSSMGALILTVSNHIPWDLPEDAPPEVRQRLAGLHDSFRTAAYAVDALVEFVQKLRDTGLWQETLLIVVGDHGHVAAPDVSASSGPTDLRSQDLLARVPLIISGGLLPADLRGRAIPWPVSQADIHYVLGSLWDVRSSWSFGQDPFLATRQIPVLSVVGEDVYLPAIPWAASRGEVLAGHQAPPAGPHHLGVLLYRDLVQALSEPIFLRDLSPRR